LFDFTAGYRETKSYVFKLDWAKVDNPHSGILFDYLKCHDFWQKVKADIDAEAPIPAAIKSAYQTQRRDGKEIRVPREQLLRVKDYVDANGGGDALTIVDPEFYPRFNFLSPLLVPPVGPDRDTYLDAIAKTLIPDGNKGGDTYFLDKGRAALTGFMHFLIAKVGDSKNYKGIPEIWQGHEPSLPMLSDWITMNQLDSTAGKAVDDFNGDVDKLGQWIRSLTDSVHPGGTNKGAKFKSDRAFYELSTLVNMADKERSGVLGTMDKALLPFKNEAVKQRASACDFTPDDLRGIQDKNGNWKPVTLYVCVNQAEASAFASITALLYEVLSLNHISYAPGDFNPKTGRHLGPYPICYLLDEFAKLPKSEAVMKGPDLGRSKKTFYNIYAQDYGQLEMIYSKPDISTVDTTTAIKIILPQNNPDTIDRIKKMVGNTTIDRSSRSYQEGMSKQANPFGWSRSQNLEGTSFLRNEDIASIEPGKHIVLVQNFLNRPMLLDTPFWFKDKLLTPKVYSNGQGPKPKTTIPDHIFLKRITEQDTLDAHDARRKILFKEGHDAEYFMTKDEIAHG